jgi:uncharacterized protein YhjY with autotransporter beta-barrel domain
MVSFFKQRIFSFILAYFFLFGVITAQAATITVTSPATSFGHLCKNGTYSIPFYASGGTAPYTFSTSTGNNNVPPAGMSINPTTGTLSGTPTAAGNNPFSVIVKDSATSQNQGTLSVVLQVDSSGSCLTSATKATLSSPSSPFSIQYNSSNNAINLSAYISGTYDFLSVSTPPSHGTFSVSGSTVYYTPGNGYHGSDSFYFTTTNIAGTSSPALVNITIPSPTITLSPSTLPVGYRNMSYSGATITSSGGSGTYTYSDDGRMPTGLSISSSGAISGTPSSSGTSTFTITSTDTGSNPNIVTTKDYTIIINDAPPSSISATNGATQSAIVSTGFVTPLQVTVLDASNNPVNGVTITFTAPNSGASATLSSSTATTNSSGIASVDATANAVTGSYTISASVSGVGTTASFNLTNTVAPLAITTSSLSTPIINQSYGPYTISTSGGTAPITFSISSGSLPTGLNISGGTISGTPTVAGDYSYTVQAKDANNITTTQTYSGTIASAPPLAITTSSLSTPIINQSYGPYTISTSGGTAPITFSISSGSLPTGLNFSGGVISGTPTLAGDYDYTVQAKDANNVTTTQRYTGTIASSLAITTSSLSIPIINQSYGPYTISTSGGSAPITFSISGSLPSGLNFSNGTISGTPLLAGDYDYTVQAKDANNVTATQRYTGTIASSLTITTSSLPTPVIGQNYGHQTISTSGGTAPITFSISSGSLPTGLNFSGGVISGTPTVAGDYDYTVQAKDANNVTATQRYIGTILSGLSITTSTLPTPIIGQAYEQTISTSGGTAPIKFSKTDSLPPGLNLNPNTGTIKGTPNKAGTYNFTIVITDRDNNTATQSYSWTIGGVTDPSKNTAVKGTSEIHVGASQRFSQAQSFNISSHVEQLHTLFNPNLTNLHRPFKELKFMGVNMGDLLDGNFEDVMMAIAHKISAQNRQGIHKPRTISTTQHKRAEDKIISPEKTIKKRVLSGNSLGSFWVGGTLNYGSMESKQGSKSRFSSSGLTLGIDYRIADKLILGFATGHGFDKTRVDEFGSHGDSNNTTGSIYTSYQPIKDIYIDALLGYGKLSFKNQRWIADDRVFVQGKRKGDNMFGFLTFSGEKMFDALTLAPYTKGEFSLAKLNPYTETGASTQTLSYKKLNLHSTALAVGMRAYYDFKIDSGLVSPFTRVQYKRSFHTQQKQILFYSQIDSDNFALNVVTTPQNTLLTTLGLRHITRSGVISELSYDYTAGSNAFNEHSGKALIRFLF